MFDVTVIFDISIINSYPISCLCPHPYFSSYCPLFMGGFPLFCWSPFFRCFHFLAFYHFFCIQATNDRSSNWVTMELRHDRVYQTFTRAIYAGLCLILFILFFRDFNMILVVWHNNLHIALLLKLTDFTILILYSIFIIFTVIIGIIINLIAITIMIINSMNFIMLAIIIIIPLTSELFCLICELCLLILMEDEKVNLFHIFHFNLSPWSPNYTAGADNLCVIGGDAAKILPERIQTGSIDFLFINHPEPPQQTGGFDSQGKHMLTLVSQ